MNKRFVPLFGLSLASLLPHEKLTCVGAVVDLQVLQAGEALVAGGASVGLLIGMSPDVDEHLVPAPGRARRHTQLNGHPAPPFLPLPCSLTWH